MITLRKLRSLPERTRARKIARMLESCQRSATLPQGRYLGELALIVESDASLPDAVRAAAADLRDRAAVLPAPAGPRETAVLLRHVDRVRHCLTGYLGAEPADWDLLPPAGLPGGSTLRAPAPLSGVSLYLESIRSPFNLGSIIRTAVAFGVATIGMSEDCPRLDHPRVLRSAMGAVEHASLRRGPLDAELRPRLALELGGESVSGFAYPPRGVLLLGSEELGLSPELLSLADARLSIPMPGPKASLNVGVACGVALAAWQAALG